MLNGKFIRIKKSFLSYDLFKYISNLDPHEKFHAFNKKNILKTSAFNHLPKSIVNQKKEDLILLYLIGLMEYLMKCFWIY